jgi:hypothetical protein
VGCRVSASTRRTRHSKDFKTDEEVVDIRDEKGYYPKTKSKRHCFTSLKTTAGITKMANKLSIDDIKSLTPESFVLLNKASPEAAKEILDTVRAERDRLDALAASFKGGESKSKEDSSPTPETTDGLSHVEAILSALRKGRKFMTSRELRASMEEAGHPMKSATFHSTVSQLIKTDKILVKKDDSKNDAKRPTNLYRVTPKNANP